MSEKHDLIFVGRKIDWVNENTKCDLLLGTGIDNSEISFERQASRLDHGIAKTRLWLGHPLDDCEKL